MHHKNEVRNAISVSGIRLHEAYESKRHGSFVNNDTQHRHGMLRPAVMVPCADCGRRSAVIVGSAD